MILSASVYRNAANEGFCQTVRRTFYCNLIFLAVALIASTAVAATSATPAAPSPAHQLQGIIRDSGGKPVKGAEVWLMAPQPTSSVSIDAHITDKKGRYFLDGDSPGGYVLVVEGWAINPADSPVTLGRGQAPEHDITVSKPTPIPSNEKKAAPKSQIVVLFDIGKDGKASNFKVIQSSGNDDLDQAALTTLKQTRWHPGYYNGLPTVSRISHTFVIVS